MPLPAVSPTIGTMLIVLYFAAAVYTVISDRPMMGLVVLAMIALLFIVKWSVLSSRCALGVIESKIRNIDEYKTYSSQAVHSAYVVGLSRPMLIPGCIIAAFLLTHVLLKHQEHEPGR